MSVWIADHTSDMSANCWNTYQKIATSRTSETTTWSTFFVRGLSHGRRSAACCSSVG